MKVHALVFNNLPHVFECGVFREGTHRVGTFRLDRVTCKACLKRIEAPGWEASIRQTKTLSLRPCPCETFWKDMLTRVQDVCARCSWRVQGNGA